MFFFTYIGGNDPFEMRTVKERGGRCFLVYGIRESN